MCCRWYERQSILYNAVFVHVRRGGLLFGLCTLLFTLRNWRRMRPQILVWQSCIWTDNYILVVLPISQLMSSTIEELKKEGNINLSCLDNIYARNILLVYAGHPWMMQMSTVRGLRCKRNTLPEVRLAHLPTALGRHATRECRLAEVSQLCYK